MNWPKWEPGPDRFSQFLARHRAFATVLLIVLLAVLGYLYYLRGQR